MPDLMNREWLNFVREFEKTDPEPHLCSKYRDQWRSEEVDAHMAWHRRLTDAWMKRG